MKTIQKINHSLFNTMAHWFNQLEKTLDSLGRKLF